jgi:hypothetical protein
MARSLADAGCGVGVRVRPLIARERAASSQLAWKWNRRSVDSARVDWASLTEPELARLPCERPVRLSFDRVFGPEESTEQVYEDLVRPLVERVVEGYNATVLAYGQTTSGKTHTISGAASASSPALSPAGSPAVAAPGEQRRPRGDADSAPTTNSTSRRRSPPQHKHELEGAARRSNAAISGVEGPSVRVGRTRRVCSRSSESRCWEAQLAPRLS